MQGNYKNKNGDQNENSILKTEIWHKGENIPA